MMIGGSMRVRSVKSMWSVKSDANEVKRVREPRLFFGGYHGYPASSSVGVRVASEKMTLPYTLAHPRPSNP